MQSGATLVFKEIDPSRWLLKKWNQLHDLIVARQRVQTLAAPVAEAWLRDIGFDIEPAVRQRRLLYPHYTIVACKP
jgi:hypothetical protein